MAEKITNASEKEVLAEALGRIAHSLAKLPPRKVESACNYIMGFADCYEQLAADKNDKTA